MKKVVAAMTIGMAFTGAGTAQAESRHGQQLAECKRELASLYGEDARIRINGLAPGDKGVLTLRVYPPGEGLQRVQCVPSPDVELQPLGEEYRVALRSPEQSVDTLPLP